MTGYALALSEAEVARYRAMAAGARVDEASAWDAAGIVPGARVADVGCGPGAALLEMADVVGAGGSVVGVDADPVALETARALIDEAGAAHAHVVPGRAEATGLPAGSVDVAVLRHVLAHNGGRERAIVQHLAGLVRPQGCVYLVDVDLTAMRVLHLPDDLSDLDDRYLELHRRRGNDLQVGLRLADLLDGAGLAVVHHSGAYRIVTAPAGLRPPAWAAREAMVAEGVATRDDLARWEAAYARLDARAQRPVVFVPSFSATGRRVT